jgi:D-aminoacyl-tRNA deacylase
MRLVVQRVKSAKVTKIDTGEVVGKIGLGMLVLFGVGKGDSEKDADTLSEKLIKLRIMSDENDKMNLSVGDIGGEILVVSQFTLYADTSSGNRPSFIAAGEPDRARELYLYFIEKLKEKGAKVETGSFGEYMEIDAKLDGPVTILY